MFMSSQLYIGAMKRLFIGRWGAFCLWLFGWVTIIEHVSLLRFETFVIVVVAGLTLIIEIVPVPERRWWRAAKKVDSVMLVGLIIIVGTAALTVVSTALQ